MQRKTYINNNIYYVSIGDFLSYGINNNIDVKIYICLLNILLNNEVETIDKVDNILLALSYKPCNANILRKILCLV